MNIKTMNEAKKEATRFLHKVAEVEAKMKELGEHSQTVFYGSKETGALRRASLDLTRALAKLRRS